MYEADGLETVSFDFLPPAEWGRARERYAGEYVSGPQPRTYYVGFDVNRPPFDDERVRRAFTLATDIETLADVALGGYVFPATGGFVPPGIPGHSPGIGLPYDPEGARHLLAEAGYPGGHGFPTIDALTMDRPDALVTIEYLQAQWLENLGVEITWKTMELEPFLDRVFRERPQMYLTGWVADYPDPDGFLRVSEWRFTAGWQNNAYDELVEGARRVMDQEERMRMYAEADRILVKAAPILLLAYGRFDILVKPWVRTYPSPPIKTWFWKDVVVEAH
jgi:oligopeptide transport system substrate-binding protein